MVLTVELGGPAHLYARAVPEDLSVLGIVKRDSGEVGALVRHLSGSFAQLNGSVLQKLNKREVLSAIAEACIVRIGKQRAT
jgi:hypothetical protein